MTPDACSCWVWMFGMTDHPRPVIWLRRSLGPLVPSLQLFQALQKRPRGQALHLPCLLRKYCTLLNPNPDHSLPKPLPFQAFGGCCDVTTLQALPMW
jgi:hypothetical protein